MVNFVDHVAVALTHWRQSWKDVQHSCDTVDRIGNTVDELTTESIATNCQIQVFTDLLPKPATNSNVYGDSW